MIEKGKIVNTVVVRQLFDSLNDGTYKVTITKGSIRTDQQRKYYFSTVVPMCKVGLRDIGEGGIKTNSDAHEYLKKEFLTVKTIDDATGELVIRIRSTKDLSTVEFIEYVEEIYQWAAEFLSVVIPSPNTQVDIFKV